MVDNAASKATPAKALPPVKTPPPPIEAKQAPVVVGESGFQKMFEKVGALISGIFSKIASAIPKPKPNKMAAQYVPETPGDIADKRGDQGGGEFETEVDDFLRLVKEKKKLSLREAASALGESEVVVEEWATILDRSGLVKLIYPGNPMESPYVVLREPGPGSNSNRT